MKRICGKIAAIGAAVMMAVSMVGLDAYADDVYENNYALYISNTGAVTNKTMFISRASSAGSVDVTYKVNSIVSGCSVSRSIKVGGYTPTNSTGTYSTVGTRNVTHSNSNIKKGYKINVTMSLNPKPTGIGSAVSGKVYGA